LERVRLTSDMDQVAGWSKGLFPHTSLDAEWVSCFKLTNRKSRPGHNETGHQERTAIPCFAAGHPVDAKTDHSLFPFRNRVPTRTREPNGTLATKPGCRV